MLKQFEEPIKETRCEGIKEFVTQYNLRTAFKKEFGCSIDEWDYDTTDQDAIEILLEGKEGLWRCVFVEDDDDGLFLIQEYDNKPSKIERAINCVGNMIAWVGNNPDSKAKELHGQLTKTLLTLKEEK